MSNLFVEPDHGAGHSDVSQADPLSHQEGAGVQVLVQNGQSSLHVLLGLLCGLGRQRQRNDCAALHNMFKHYNTCQVSTTGCHTETGTHLHHSYQIII